MTLFLIKLLIKVNKSWKTNRNTRDIYSYLELAIFEIRTMKIAIKRLRDLVLEVIAGAGENILIGIINWIFCNMGALFSFNTKITKITKNI